MVEANGTTIHVDVAGHGAPVLLVPGAGGDARQYVEMARLLAENHTVIAYDRRNNGRSPLQQDGTLRRVWKQHRSADSAGRRPEGSQPVFRCGAA